MRSAQRSAPWHCLPGVTSLAAASLVASADAAAADSNAHPIELFVEVAQSGIPADATPHQNEWIISGVAVEVATAEATAIGLRGSGSVDFGAGFSMDVAGRAKRIGPDGRLMPDGSGTNMIGMDTVFAYQRGGWNLALSPDVDAVSPERLHAPGYGSGFSASWTLPGGWDIAAATAYHRYTAADASVGTLYSGEAGIGHLPLGRARLDLGYRIDGDRDGGGLWALKHGPSVSLSADLSDMLNCRAEYRQQFSGDSLALDTASSGSLALALDWNLQNAGFSGASMNADLALRRDDPESLETAAHFNLAMTF